MYVHLMSTDKTLWIAIEGDPFVPKITMEGVGIIKPPLNQNDEETKKGPYDLKSRNILIFALSLNVYYSISHHSSSQSVWNVLQILHKGIKDIK